MLQSNPWMDFIVRICLLLMLDAATVSFTGVGAATAAAILAHLWLCLFVFNFICLFCICWAAAHCVTRVSG